MKYNVNLEKKIGKDNYRKVLQIAQRFHKENFECYFVGGWIRDILLGKKENFNDIDIATNAIPEQVIKLFPKVIPTGIKHGTVTILFKDFKVECTTYRTEFKYSNHRHPDQIAYAKSIYEDLSRRDFTINAFAYDPFYQILIDEYNGLKDLKEKKIRCIGNPKDRFLEDGLRPIRACRFLATLGFEIEEETKKAIQDPDVKRAIQKISIERITEELKKGFKAQKTSLMLRTLYELEILQIFLGNDIKQLSNLFYEYLDCFSHLEFKMALWFWYANFDIKSVSQKFKFSNLMYNTLNFLVEFINFFLIKHPFLLWKEFENVIPLNQYKEFKEYRKILGELKKEFPQPMQILLLLEEFITHSELDIKNHRLNFYKNLKLFFDHLQNSLRNDPLLVKDLAIKGEDLIALGFRGKEIGNMQNILLEIVWEAPQKNHKEILLEQLKNQDLTKLLRRS